MPITFTSPYISEEYINVPNKLRTSRSSTIYRKLLAIPMRDRYESDLGLDNGMSPSLLTKINSVRRKNKSILFSREAYHKLSYERKFTRNLCTSIYDTMYRAFGAGITEKVITKIQKYLAKHVAEIASTMSNGEQILRQFTNVLSGTLNGSWTPALNNSDMLVRPFFKEMATEIEYEYKLETKEGIIDIVKEIVAFNYVVRFLDYSCRDINFKELDEVIDNVALAPYSYFLEPNRTNDPIVISKALSQLDIELNVVRVIESDIGKTIKNDLSTADPLLAPRRKEDFEFIMNTFGFNKSAIIELVRFSVFGETRLSNSMKSILVNNYELSYMRMFNFRDILFQNHNRRFSLRLVDQINLLILNKKEPYNFRY